MYSTKIILARNVLVCSMTLLALSQSFAQYSNHQGMQAIKGKMVIIDTRDKEICLKIEESIMNSNFRKSNISDADLCSPGTDDNPYAVVSFFEQQKIEGRPLNKAFHNVISGDDNIYTHTRNLGAASVATAGVLYLMPESVSKWDKDDLRNGSLLEKYKDNVRRGPVVDKDDWVINYIGHPISGAIYYQIARNSNLSILKSFGYSVVMSTFFWEYGVEAFAEVPSIQDLLITPILGSILGEGFYRLEKKIDENDGKVFNSYVAGKVLKVVLNPGKAASDKINSLLNKDIIVDSNFGVTQFKAHYCSTEPSIGMSTVFEECRKPALGIGWKFKF